MVEAFRDGSSRSEIGTVVEGTGQKRSYFSEGASLWTPRAAKVAHLVARLQLAGNLRGDLV